MLNKLSLTTFLFSLVFIACEKDEKTETETQNPPANILNVDGVEQQIAFAELIDYNDPENGVHSFELNFETVEDNDGKYSYLYFEIYADQSSTLPDGTYPYSSNDNEVRAFTFDYGDLFFNEDENLVAEREGEIMEGQVNIKNTGSNTFEVSFNGVAYEDSLTGSGEVVFLDTINFSGTYSGVYFNESF